jgi:hypothetical protein
MKRYFQMIIYSQSNLMEVEWFKQAASDFWLFALLWKKFLCHAQARIVTFSAVRANIPEDRGTQIGGAPKFSLKHWPE